MSWRRYSTSAVASVLFAIATPAIAEAPRERAQNVVENGPFQRDFPVEGGTAGGPTTSGGFGGGGGSSGGSGGGISGGQGGGSGGGPTHNPRRLGSGGGGSGGRVSGPRGISLPGAGAFGTMLTWLLIGAIVAALCALIAWLFLSISSPDVANEAMPIGLSPDEAKKQKQQVIRGDLRSEAERLAREGRFEEAVHLLLLAAIVHLSRGAAPPDSRTSRELLGHFRLDTRSRDAFSALVLAVERSLFGGQPIGQDDWRECASRHDALVTT